jgi:hypothetical protein
MPKQTGKSSLLAKYGDKVKKAVAAHKDDPIEWGSSGGLPPGIEGGVARLCDCKFTEIAKGKQNAGEVMFYAAGIVLVPKTGPGGERLEGLRTQISEPLYDTPTRKRQSTDEHIDWVLNEMKKLLGGDAKAKETIDSLDGDLEAIAAALKDAEPTFRFRTWKGSPATEGPYKGKDPMVNHEWKGACDYVEGEEGSDVEDNTASEPDAPAKEEEADNSDELTKLGETADDDNAKEQEEAQRDLSKKAKAAGLDPEEFPTWTAVAEALTGGAEKEEESEAVLPEKGGTCNYKPPKAKKKVQCEIVAVFKDKKTVNLKNLDDGKSYKGVSFDEIDLE